MDWFDSLFDHHPYLAYVCIYVGLFTLFALPVLWVTVGVVSGEWDAPAYFVLGIPGLGFVMGNLSYILNERL